MKDKRRIQDPDEPSGPAKSLPRSHRVSDEKESTGMKGKLLRAGTAIAGLTPLVAAGAPAVQAADVQLQVGVSQWLVDLVRSVLAALRDLPETLVRKLVEEAAERAAEKTIDALTELVGLTSSILFGKPGEGKSDTKTSDRSRSSRKKTSKQESSSTGASTAKRADSDVRAIKEQYAIFGRRFGELVRQSQQQSDEPSALAITQLVTAAHVAGMGDIEIAAFVTIIKDLQAGERSRSGG